MKRTSLNFCYDALVVPLFFFELSQLFFPKGVFSCFFKEGTETSLTTPDFEVSRNIICWSNCLLILFSLKRQAPQSNRLECYGTSNVSARGGANHLIVWSEKLRTASF